MHTAEIGRDPILSPAIPPLHVVSTALKIESRIEVVGAEPSDTFHARSFPSARRFVLATGVGHDAGSVVLDALDQLPDLPVRGVVAAVIQCLSRHARSRRTTPPPVSLRVVRVGTRRFEWTGQGLAQMLLYRRPTFWRRASLISLSANPQDTTGVCPIVRGDDVILWVGSALAENRLAGLIGQMPDARAEHLEGAAVHGCLVTLRRC